MQQNFPSVVLFLFTFKHPENIMHTFCLLVPVRGYMSVKIFNGISKNFIFLISLSLVFYGTWFTHTVAIVYEDINLGIITLFCHIALDCSSLSVYDYHFIAFRENINIYFYFFKKNCTYLLMQ